MMVLDGCFSVAKVFIGLNDYRQKQTKTKGRCCLP